jgi:hypothetical protein
MVSTLLDSSNPGGAMRRREAKRQRERKGDREVETDRQRDEKQR